MHCCNTITAILYKKTTLKKLTQYIIQYDKYYNCAYAAKAHFFCAPAC